MELNNKRIFIRNVDRTDEISSFRILPDGRVGITFRGSNFEYSYNKDNVSIQSINNPNAQIDSSLENDRKIEEEQAVLDEILDTIKVECEKYEYALRHSYKMGGHYVSDDVLFIKYGLEPYNNLLNNPYFAKFKFDGDPCSYYISEHDVSKLPRELRLPENTKIISVYSDLGRNIYNRSKIFYAYAPIMKKRKLYDDYEVYVYDKSNSLNSSTRFRYDVIQKYRFNIRNNKILELNDETPR